MYWYFFNAIIKSKGKTYEKVIKLSKNSDYTIGNLLNYEYFSKKYNLIAIDLSKQIELGNPDLKQQINFICKLEDDRATMLLSLKNQMKLFEFSQDYASIIWNRNTKSYKFLKWFKQRRV